MCAATLTLPAGQTRQNAAIQLLIQLYIAPHKPDLQITEGIELSLSSLSAPSSPTFFEVFQNLLESTGQTNEALSTSSSSAEDKKAVEHWIQAATTPSEEQVDLKSLDEVLKAKTYITGNTLTAADVAVFANLHPYIAQASHATLLSHPNVTRHFDLIQHTPSITSAVSKLPSNTFSSSSTIPINLDDVPVVERKYESSKKDKKEKAAAAVANGGSAGEAAVPKKQKGKQVVHVEGDGGAAVVEEKKQSGEDKAAVPAEGKKEKKEKVKKEAAASADAAEGGAGKKAKKEKGSGGGGAAAPPAPEEPLGPGLIDMRVGLIVDVKKHPDADSLYVEQIDVGEAEPRTVVSGLVNYIPIEEMRNKYLIAICNLKPASMRGVKSFAMVLAATSKEGKEGMGSVELVAPPAGSKPGDRVYFEGFEATKALEQLPPKKKIFETIQPGFTTLENRDAAWVSPEGKQHRIVTDKGVCQAPTFVGASLS